MSVLCQTVVFIIVHSGHVSGIEYGCAVCLPHTFDILRYSGCCLPHRALSAYRFAAALVLNRTHSCRDFAFGDVATIIRPCIHSECGVSEAALNSGAAWHCLFAVSRHLP